MVVIDKSADGQRIDNFLLRTLGNIPKSHVYRLLRTGQVRVNGGRKKPVYRLVVGDEVRIPPVKTRESAKINVPEDVMQRVASDVMFEDERLIVLNKKSGLAVHAGSGTPFGLIDAVRQLRADKSLELVHRLDKDTSGCLLIARGRESLLQLQDVFRDQRLEKQYLALTAGVWKQQRVTVRNRLKKNAERGGERVVTEDDSGKTAVSHFSVVEQFGGCALVRVRIETGRTHQIRVHAAGLGHAIIGDHKYGEKLENGRFRKAGLKRLFLHAESIELIDFADYRFRAPPDSEWQQAMAKLRAGG